jgi:protoporphyrinogen/coproporphyrinogen III oxidase
MRDVAVIGAGAAGLAAALELQRSGAQVTLYERTERAGGALRTEQLEGARVDVGVQLVSSSHTALFELCARTGTRELLRRAPGRDAMWRKERAHAITYGSVASMATSSALPTTLKLKLAARYLPFLSSHARGLDANDPSGTGGLAHDDESIAAWGERELGRDFVELLVYPLLGAYHGAVPEQTSAALYHALARVGIDVSVYAVLGGFGALPDAWLRAFRQQGGQYRSAVEVTAVSGTDSGTTVSTAEGAASHDAVVVAVPAPRARGLVPGDELRAWLSGVRMQPAFTVAFLMERPYPGNYFGLSFPRTDPVGERVVALCVQRNKLGGLVPGGGDVLVALPAPSGAAQLLERGDEAVASAILESLERAVPGMRRRVVSTHVQRFDDGYVLFPPGYLHHLHRFDPAWLPKRIALAGQYLVAPSVEGAVRSGIRAAARVLEGLR